MAERQAKSKIVQIVDKFSSYCSRDLLSLNELNVRFDLIPARLPRVFHGAEHSFR